MFRDLPHPPSVCTAVVVLCVMLAALSLYVLALLFVSLTGAVSVECWYSDGSYAVTDNK